MTVTTQTNKVLFLLNSKIELTITPLTLLAQKILHSKAWERYPEPDRAPYEKPIEGAFVDDTTTRAEDNPEWQVKNAIESRKRDNHFQELILKTCVDTANKDALLDAYSGALKGLDPDGVLFEDAFIGVLYCFLASQDEITHIVKIALGRLPLTEVETRDGLTFFRYVAL